MTPLPIILPWINNWPQTRDTLEDCLAQTPPEGTRLQVLLFGNGVSPADDRAAREWLRTQAPLEPTITYYAPPVPIALAAVWNRCLQVAWDLGAEEAWVVNNDLELHPRMLHHLSLIRHATEAWFVTGIGVTPAQFQAYCEAPQIDTASRGGPDFSCFLIGKACHQQFPFDPGFFPAYYEDNDYHRRLQLAGHGEKIFGLNLPFHHIGGGSGSVRELQREATSRGEEAMKAFAVRWQQRFGQSQAYYLRKWGGLPGSETFATPFNIHPREVTSAQS